MPPCPAGANDPTCVTAECFSLKPAAPAVYPHVRRHRRCGHGGLDRLKPLNGSGSVSRVAAPAATPVAQPALQQRRNRRREPADNATLTRARQDNGRQRRRSTATASRDQEGDPGRAFPILPATIADRLLALELELESAMTRRDALIRVIDALHAEIAALKTNDVAALERATQRQARRDRGGRRARHRPRRRRNPRAGRRGEPAERDLPDLRQPDGGKCSPPPANSDRRCRPPAIAPDDGCRSYA